MTAKRLSALILSVDEDAQLNETVWFFHVAELETAVIYDIAADRMRIVCLLDPLKASRTTS